MQIERTRQARRLLVARRNNSTTHVSLSSSGDLHFPVHPVHPVVRSWGRHSALCGGQQRHPPPAADAEAGREAVLHLVPHQQICKPVDLHRISPERTVLPHLVHRQKLLHVGPWRVLPDRHDGHEHHDPDLFLPAAPRRSVIRKTELSPSERNAELEKVSH